MSRFMDAICDKPDLIVIANNDKLMLSLSFALIFVSGILFC